MRKSYPEKMRNYRNSIQNLHRILPKSMRNRPQIDENTFLERFRRQVATKSARGWFPQTAGVPLLAPGWSKTVPNGSILGTPLDPKWLQNRTVEDRLALRPSKNGLWKGVRIKHENSMKKRCENRRFLMAQNHVWRYTLRL